MSNWKSPFTSNTRAAAFREVTLKCIMLQQEEEVGWGQCVLFHPLGNVFPFLFNILSKTSKFHARFQTHWRRLRPKKQVIHQKQNIKTWPFLQMWSYLWEIKLQYCRTIAENWSYNILLPAMISMVESIQTWLCGEYWNSRIPTGYILFFFFFFSEKFMHLCKRKSGWESALGHAKEHLTLGQAQRIDLNGTYT